MCELVKLLFIISVVCSKFYAVNRNFTRPPVPPVPTNIISDIAKNILKNIDIDIARRVSENIDITKKSENIYIDIATTNFRNTNNAK